MRSPAVLRRFKFLLFSSRSSAVLSTSSLPPRIPRRNSPGRIPRHHLSTTPTPSDPPPEDPPGPNDGPDFLADAKFDDALNKLLITLHPQTQHRATYTSPLGAPTEPTLALYCPIEGGDYIIDATVAELARRTGAEVLVLDAVQLAAGEWGHFGPANSLSLLRNPLHFPSSAPTKYPNSRLCTVDDDDESDSPFFSPPKMTLALMTPPTMQGRALITSSARRTSPPTKVKVFFDALVNMPSKAEVPATPSRSRPRLVYIRDFPTLAASSSSWYPPLLSAIRERRRGPISRPSSPVSNPMTIIFGMTPSLTPPVSHNSPSNGLVSLLMSRNASATHLSTEPKAGKADWGEDEAAEKLREKRLRDRLKKWESGDAALLDEFPKLSTAEEGEDNEERPEIILIGSSGLPSFPSTNGASSSGSGTGQNQSSFFRTSILIPRARSASEERAARVSRRREINELTLRMGVGAAGGVVEKESAASTHSDPPSAEGTPEAKIADPLSQPNRIRMWEDWGNRVELWSNVRRIADRAIGNTLASTSISGPSEKTTLEATVVHWSSVHDAWAAHRSSKDRRSSWLKEAFSVHRTTWEQEQADENALEEKEEQIDAVVERVRNETELDPHEQKLLGCIVDAASVSTSFDQVHLPPHTIDSVRTIVSLPLLHPGAFKQGILKQHGMTGCLLFGPPGTGKTLVVRALAKEAGCRMLTISPSDVMDMYVGEGEKLVKAVFSLARRLSPCVVFLDEIDALFGARMSARESGGAFAHRGVITEFMQEMDGLKSSKEDSVIVIGATNRPFDLDDAVLRRLPRRLLVDLPGEKEREGILKILLREETLGDDLDVPALAKKTESFSGSDLKHLCVSAALDAVKENVRLPWSTSSLSSRLEAMDTETSSPPPSIIEANSPSDATISSQTSSIPGDSEEPIVTSSQPSSSEAHIPAPAPIASEPSSEPHTRVLHLHNFAKALKEITPSSSESLGSLAELRKWNDEFGEGRRDKKRQQFWGKGRFGFTDKSNKDGENGRVVHSSKSNASTIDRSTIE
ncbi:hypothetical protein FPV67DRAFT_1557446 [Lyophyllum atratum]|nr:hypothetical protein FPV67DRAFT_1557446 [Lyophyllum atratum]